MLAKLLSQFETSASPSGIKCVPSYVAPDLASAIRRHISQSMRQRKGTVPCYYISELATYTLPPGNLLHKILLEPRACFSAVMGVANMIFMQFEFSRHFLQLHSHGKKGAKNRIT